VLTSSTGSRYVGQERLHTQNYHRERFRILSQPSLRAREQIDFCLGSYRKGPAKSISINAGAGRGGRSTRGANAHGTRGVCARPNSSSLHDARPTGSRRRRAHGGPVLRSGDWAVRAQTAPLTDARRPADAMAARARTHTHTHTHRPTRTHVHAHDMFVCVCVCVCRAPKPSPTSSRQPS